MSYEPRKHPHSRDLTLRHGKGFSRSNLTRFRQFYLAYPIRATLSHKLSWSHYLELLKLEDTLERSFYEQQAIREKWSVPELKRQKKTSLGTLFKGREEFLAELFGKILHNLSATSPATV